MNYQDILNNIFTALPMYHKVGSSAYKEGLENIEELVEIVGHPEREFKTIHVAGTNGKGSVSHLLSSFYQEKGWKVGLYTSPHLVDFRERIKINGEMIPQEKVVAFFEKYQTYFQNIEPSFFEMVTAMAFRYFADEKVDIAIIEVGLGGRLDATNIIHPIISVITNISLEHTQLLGDTLKKIAFEKAGIIKPQTPVIIGKYVNATLPVFQQRAQALAAPLITTDNVCVKEEKVLEKSNFCYLTVMKEGKIVVQHIKFELMGEYQLENVATFVQTVSVLHAHEIGFTDVLQRAITNVLLNTHFMGRWQIVSQCPLTICDTGHNIGGFEWISKQLQSMKYHHLWMILGFVSDKDIRAIIAVLPQGAEYVVCKASVERAKDPAIIETMMREAGLSVQTSALSIYKTYKEVQYLAQEDDIIYIGGSTFVVADFLQEYLLC